MSAENFFVELLDAIRKHVPEIMLFLSIGIGFLIGKIRFGPVQLGGVCGTLIAALAIGQFNFVIAPGVKNLFFAIFIFALGYSGGPQFFANLNAKGLRLGLLSLVEVITVFTLVMIAILLFKFDPGTASGLVAGAATESAVIGTASEAIGRLPISATEIAKMQSNVVTAYSITYIFGLISIVVFTSQIAPLILKVNLKEEAERVWMEMGASDSKAENNADPIVSSKFVSSVFEVTFAAGRSVSEVVPLLGGQAGIEKVLRKGELISVEPDLKLQKGDRILLLGDRLSVIHGSAIIGIEKADTANLNLVVEKEEVVLTDPLLIGRSLGEIRRDVKFSQVAHHVYISGIKRSGHSLPLGESLVLNRGDVIQLYGAPEAIDQIAVLIGKPIRVTDRTNFIFVGFGIIAGILIGSLGFHAGSIFVTLGTGGGVLVAGLIWGWYQAKNPEIPGIPPSAIELMKDLGLALFIACVGLASGPQAIALIKSYGIILPLIGMSITLIPAILSLFIGRYLLKLEVPVLLGGIAGQQCSTPALSAVQAAAGNATPVLGYTITYAISNVLLPLLGPIVVGAATLLQ